MKGQCTAIKTNGGRCQKPADGPNGLCWTHDPANAERRRSMASRAGRARGNQEVRVLKEEIKALIQDVRAGAIERNDAAAMLQGYRVLREYIELERRVRETDDLAAELEDLKRESGAA